MVLHFFVIDHADLFKAGVHVGGPVPGHGLDYDRRAEGRRECGRQSGLRNRCALGRVPGHLLQGIRQLRQKRLVTALGAIVGDPQIDHCPHQCQHQHRLKSLQHDPFSEKNPTARTANAVEIPEPPQGVLPGLTGRHSHVDIVPRAHLEVELEFLHDLVVHLADGSRIGKRTYSATLRAGIIRS